MNSVTLPARWHRLRRFLRSPKGFLLVALVLLAVLAAPSVGAGAALGTIAVAVVGAAGMEVALVRFGHHQWRSPSSALLSGLIVGLILSPQEPWGVALAAGIIATAAKHMLRIGQWHVLNPAAAGLLAVYALFATGQSWWGALPELPALALPVLLIAGYLVADRANKLPTTLSFLATYVVLFTGATFTAGPAHVGDIFRPPFVQMALFFSFFMATDPPTSPVRFGDQLWFGSIVAIASFITYIETRGLYFLLVGILVGNAVFAAWRLAVRALRKTDVQERPHERRTGSSSRPWHRPDLRLRALLRKPIKAAQPAVWRREARQPRQRLAMLAPSLIGAAAGPATFSPIRHWSSAMVAPRPADSESKQEAEGIQMAGTTVVRVSTRARSLVLPALTAALFGFAIALRIDRPAGLIAAALSLLLMVDKRRIWMLGAGAAVVILVLPVVPGFSSAAAHRTPADTKTAHIVVNQSVHHPAGWTMTVTTVDPVNGDRMRINLAFRNDSDTVGTLLGADPTNTFVTDSRGARFPLIAGSGSILEDPIHRPELVPGGEVHTFVVVSSPNLKNQPLTFTFADYPELGPIALSAAKN